jgi:hypothetical protein
VSSGLGNATGSYSPPSGGSPTGNIQYDEDRDRERPRHCYDQYREIVRCPFGVTEGGYTPFYTRVRFHTVKSPSSSSPAKVDFYAGAQKVHDSDGSASIAVAVTDGRFRIAGAYSHYFERLEGGGVLTMAMPTLMGGVRIDDMGDTRVFLEGGVVHARTNGDQMGNSSVTGPIAGIRIEHPLTNEISLIGAAHTMWFDHDIKANEGEAGIRYKYLQAGFKVLDFNVGPPLYGPEVGVSF